MCGRFASFKNQEKLKNIFDLKNKKDKIFSSYNISPGQNISVIFNYEFHNYVLPSYWGYSFINNETNKKQLVINSRLETINNKMLFKESFLKRKCIIPINGYYEWKTENNDKIPYYIQLGDGELIFLAGIWRKEIINNQKTRVFCIITKEASNSIIDIHDRMPFILNANNATKYLENQNDNSFLSDTNINQGIDLNYHEVSKFVNSPKNNAVKCLELLN